MLNATLTSCNNTSGARLNKVFSKDDSVISGDGVILVKIHVDTWKHGDIATANTNRAVDTVSSD